MKILNKKIPLVIFLIVITPLLVFSKETSVSEIEEYNKKFIAFQQDFVDFRSANLGMIGYEITTKIRHIKDLAFLAFIIEDPAARNHVSGMLYIRKTDIAEEINLAIRLVNVELTNTKSNAIAVTANEMKKELAKFREILLTMDVKNVKP